MTPRVPMVSLEHTRDLGEAMGVPVRSGDHGLRDLKRRHMALGNAGMVPG